jgi:hypothetical protein
VQTLPGLPPHILDKGKPAAMPGRKAKGRRVATTRRQPAAERVDALESESSGKRDCLIKRRESEALF